MKQQTLKARDVFWIGVGLLLALGFYISVQPSMARGPVMVEHGVGGGGFGSPANAETIVIPPWIWEWVGGFIADKLIGSLNDCGVNTTCNPNNVNGGVGGGGFSGWPQCQSCNTSGPPGTTPGGGGPWARPAWNWLTFQQEAKQ